MAFALEAVRPTDFRQQRADPRAHELDHPTADRAHEMMVALAGVNVLIEVAVALQPLARDETAFDE